MTNEMVNSKQMEQKAPLALLEEVSRRSGRSIHTIKAVIYGRVTSAPVSRVVAQVRKEWALGDPQRAA